MTWRDVPGWFNERSDLYDEAALTAPPGSCLVEVGVAFGRSLLYLADRVRATGRTDVRVVAVDPWVPYPEHHFLYVPYPGMPEGERRMYEYTRHHGTVYQAFMHNLHDTGLDQFVDVLRMPSVEAAKMFARPPHFVFIDGWHTYEHVKADLDAWWSCAGGAGPEWMAGDDYNPGDETNFPGVWKAVHAKFGAENVGRRQLTNWVVRRSHLEVARAGRAATQSGNLPQMLESERLKPPL